ncbi:MAG: MBL fold metallo-hydrolase [Lachnospiraceae bacterium]|nr:MBL fold metallo-hydrolase [Lachnospiraceae bacterium]
MKIINLIEDTRGREGCAFEHGLSFYIETEKHKLLMDTGATDAFLKNAAILGIDLGQVDTVVLSHGHYDHTGGLLAFAEQNPEADIYLQASAGEAYYHWQEEGARYIGMDKAILSLPKLQLLAGNRKIDEELFLFSHISGRRFWAKSNQQLKRKTKERFCQDEFDHEQCLVITERDNHVLLSGCAHNGILNILDAYRAIYHGDPGAVISGFHMAQKEGYTEEDQRIIRQTAEELKQTDTVFYTGHCTGKAAFDQMKEIMGEQLRAIHSGEEILH